MLLGAVTIAVLVAGCGGHVGSGDSTGSFAVTQPPEVSDSGVITGQIISLRDGGPVNGARIVVGGAVAISDASGSFTVDRVQPGEHWLTVTGDLAIVGGPIRVEVATGASDVGRVVVDGTSAVPPAEPDL